MQLNFAFSIIKITHLIILTQEVETLKSTATQTVFLALSAARPTDIQACVKSLTTAEMDILTKYLYRAMKTPEVFNAAVLLSWHKEVVDVTGLGSIVRVMTSRTSV